MLELSSLFELGLCWLIVFKQINMYETSTYTHMQTYVETQSICIYVCM